MQPIEVNGELFISIREAARKYNLDRSTVEGRIHRGWSVEETFELIPKKNAYSNKGVKVIVSGVQYSTLREVEEAFGIDQQTVSRRIFKYGWTPEQAVGVEPPPYNAKQIRKNLGDKLATLEAKSGERQCLQCGETRALESFKKCKDSAAGYKRHCKLCSRVAQDRKRYGDGTARKRLMEEQNFQCFCGKTTRLCLDHCHKTGKIRGILCNNCNSIIGLCKENIETLSKLISYLELHQSTEAG